MSENKKDFSKYKWFFDINHQYIIKNCNVPFGTIMMPTGTGKSIVIFEDIINTIETYIKTKSKKKIIINISSPLLNLNQQTMNEFIGILSYKYHNTKYEKLFSIFINSSDDNKNYNEQLKHTSINVCKLNELDDYFINSNVCNIAIVSSCHKSLPKFISKISKLNKKEIDIISYIDESHIIKLKDQTECIEKEVDAYVDLNKLCKYSTKVIALSATPDNEVTKCINGYNTKHNVNNKYIYVMYPSEAIDQNIIVKPCIKKIQTNCKNINLNILDTVIDDVCKSNYNKNIPHKILVTLDNADVLKQIHEELESKGYKVFSTCCKYGYNIGKSNYTDITDFIKEVDNYNDNCFVLHLRQLTQGINIKTLTDCVILSNTFDVTKERDIIQIIGRVLRTLSEDRGKSINERKKQYGGVYFITPIDDIDILNKLSKFMVGYYNIPIDHIFADKIYINTGISNKNLFDNKQEIKVNSNNKETLSIEEMFINIEKYINSYIDTFKFNINVLHDFDLDNTVNNIIKDFDDEIILSDFFDNTILKNKVIDIFNKFGITNI